MLYEPVTGNTTHTAPENRAFFPALDGLRAFAFTLVFLRHYLHLPWGWGGVNIFFVLSGFLITGILLDTRDQPHRIRNFYIRRSLRIFPLYYGLFLALVLLHPVFHWQWNRYWFAWPLYLGNFLRFMQPSSTVLGSPLEHAADGWLIIGHFPRASLLLQHFWSLCVEEQFYMLWPWAVFFVRSRKSLLSFCAAVVVAGPVVRVVMLHTAAPWLLHEELLYRFTPLQLDSLLLGALLALLWRGKHRDVLARIGSALGPLMLAVAATYIALTMPGSGVYAFFHYPYPVWEFSLGLSFINVFAAALILACLRPSTLLAKLFAWTPLRFLGRISYGAYIFHDLLHDFYAHAVAVAAKRHPMSESASLLLTAALAYASTIAISWLSFRFFESPFLELKEHWSPSSRAALAENIAPTTYTVVDAKA